MMITVISMKFEELHFPEAPRIRSIPGSRSRYLLEKQQTLEGSAVSYPLNIPVVMEEGRGATIQDVDGNIFIDFFGGAGVMAVGHHNPSVMRAVHEQQQKMTHTLDFPTEIRLELIEQIRSVMPSPLKDVRVQFGGPTGSDAVEMALKLSKYYTGRHSFIAFEGGYHGMTAGACTLNAGTFWKEPYLPMIPEVHFVPYAYCYRCPFFSTPQTCSLQCAAFYEHVLEDPHSGVCTPAAAIIEPIQGEGGSIVPPDSYMSRIAQINRSYDVPLVCDEIQAGFCRTGTYFSFEHSETVPDIITISKAIGGGFPLSAIAYREDLDVWKKGAHIGTFRGNVVAMAAGVATIQFMKDHALCSHVRDIGSYLLQRLENIAQQSEIVGDVRGRGMMLGCEMVEDKESKKPSPSLADKVRYACYQRGVLIEIGGHYNNVVRFLPALILTRELAEKGMDIIEESIRDVEKAYTFNNGNEAH
jgi:diaminobutyrate-2-oxoglutarate transaminase